MSAGNGVEMDRGDDMLRLDAMMLVVQLNLRQLLEVGWHLALAPFEPRFRVTGCETNRRLRSDHHYSACLSIPSPSRASFVACTASALHTVHCPSSITASSLIQASFQIGMWLHLAPVGIL